MTDGQEVVLLLTHFLDDRIVAGYRRLAGEAGRDVVVLFNKTDDRNPGYVPPPDVKVFPFLERDLRALGYPRKGRHIRDVDIELFSFPFHRAHPGYQRVWVVEYDVDFTGPWSRLFDAFGDDPADLLATNIHRHADNPGWENWGGLAGPDAIRAFMPLSRLSARSYDALDAAYRRGLAGHYECVVPTVIHRAGLTIEDIGGDGEFVRPGNRNRYYTSSPGVNDLSPGTFVFRPVMAAPGMRPNTLWHPVKPPTTRYAGGWRNGRLGLLRRRTLALGRRVAELFGPE
jgi:hypothetical protein